MNRPLLRWLIPALLVVGWLALGAVSGPFAGKLSSVATNDSTAFLPSSAESTVVQRELRAAAGATAVPAVIVAARSTGLTPADLDYLRSAASRIGQLPAVVTGSMSPVLPSADRQAAQLVAPIDGSVKVREAVIDIREILRDPPDGLTVLVTGPAGLVADLVTAFGGIDGMLILVAGLAVALILVAVYRSVLLPLIVLVSAVFALGTASLAVYLLADADVITLNGQSQGILFILVFGAATDYALLLVSRYREELRDNADKVAALRDAWRATITPVSASAATVIAGVLCLLLSDLNSNRGLGPVAAIGIAAAWLASMTFLPAVLALLGRSAYWPIRPALGSPHPEHHGRWATLAAGVGRRPRRVWILCTLALMIGAAFLPQLRADGTAQTDVFLTPVDSATGQQVLSQHFPGGSGSPTVIVADAAAGAAVRAAAATVGGIAQLGELDAPGNPRVAGGRVAVLAVLSDPLDSAAALDTVSRLRQAVHAVPGAHALVGGPTATQLDTRQTSEHDRSLIIPIVLVVIFAILALLLRALVAPLVLIGTVVLSFAATLGVTALVFNHLFDFPGADPSVPLFAFVFLVALGVDYNIFLMTRVREEAANLGTRAGTGRALVLTGGVITSAGVVLAATFAALAVIPLLFLAQIAFIVAFGVLLDTLLVRTLLVPALTIDLDRRVWWPSRLSRLGSSPGRHRSDPG